jgi:ribosomal protein S8E
MGYSTAGRINYFHKAMKQKKERDEKAIRKKQRDEKAIRKKQKKETDEKAIRKKEIEQENASTGQKLLDPEDLVPVVDPDHWGDHQHQHDTSDGEAEGGLLSSHEGQVTSAQLLDMKPAAYESLEMDDAEESYVSSCTLKKGVITETK